MRNRYLLMNVAGDQGSGGGDVGKENIQDSGSQGDTGSGDQGQKGEAKKEESGTPDLSALPDWAQKELKSLRGEAGKYRTDNKGLKERLDKFEVGFKKMFGDEGEDDKETPEQKIQNLQSHTQSLEVKTALMEIAIENSISKDEYEYFEFLMGKALNNLKDDEEMTEDQLAAIISGTKSKKASSADSSVGDKGGKPPVKNDGAVSLEDFVKMGMVAKSELFNKNRELYNSLFEQAKIKKLL